MLEIQGEEDHEKKTELVEDGVGEHPSAAILEVQGLVDVTASSHVTLFTEVLSVFAHES